MLMQISKLVMIFLILMPPHAHNNINSNYPCINRSLSPMASSSIKTKNQLFIHNKKRRVTNNSHTNIKL